MSRKADDIKLDDFVKEEYTPQEVSELTMLDSDYTETGVCSADNVLQSDASDNKKVFDTFPKLCAAKLNGLIAAVVKLFTRCETMEDNAQENVIEKITVNGEASTITEKGVNLTIPTKLSQLTNDNNTVKDANYVHTDNNYTDEAVAEVGRIPEIEGAVQLMADGVTALENKALGFAAADKAHDDSIENITGQLAQVAAIAKGAAQGVSFSDYQTMVEFFNQNMTNPDTGDLYVVGQPVLIGTVDVPDLWISNRYASVVEYSYTTDEALVSDLTENLFVRVGYYSFGILETQKVDLTGVVKDEAYIHTDNNYTNEDKALVNGDIRYYFEEDFLSVISSLGDVPEEWNVGDYICCTGDEKLIRIAGELGQEVPVSMSALITAGDNLEYYGFCELGWFRFETLVRLSEYAQKNEAYLRKQPLRIASDTTVAGQNTFRIAAGVESINLTYVKENADEVVVIFETTAGDGDVVLPNIAISGVEGWVGQLPAFVAGKHYEINIAGGYGVVGEFEVVG